MLQITCCGTHHEIGYAHGKAAATHINRSIVFYTSLFHLYTKKSWTEVTAAGAEFLPYLEKAWPRYLEEMRGVAEGSGRDVLDIIALNVRTEIAFGLFSDDCTSLAWHGDDYAWLGQNWDWMEPQKHNLVLLTIISADTSIPWLVQSVFYHAKAIPPESGWANQLLWPTFHAAIEVKDKRKQDWVKTRAAAMQRNGGFKNVESGLAILNDVWRGRKVLGTGGAYLDLVNSSHEKGLCLV